MKAFELARRASWAAAEFAEHCATCVGDKPERVLDAEARLKLSASTSANILNNAEGHSKILEACGRAWMLSGTGGFVSDAAEASCYRLEELVHKTTMACLTEDWI